MGVPHCSFCFEAGHNIRTCTAPGAEENRQLHPKRNETVSKRDVGIPKLFRDQPAIPVSPPVAPTKRSSNPEISRLFDHIEALESRIREHVAARELIDNHIANDRIELGIARRRLENIEDAQLRSASTPTSAAQPGTGKPGVLDVEDPQQNEDRHQARGQAGADKGLLGRNSDQHERRRDQDRPGDRPAGEP